MYRPAVSMVSGQVHQEVSRVPALHAVTTDNSVGVHLQCNKEREAMAHCLIQSFATGNTWTEQQLVDNCRFYQFYVQCIIKSVCVSVGQSVTQNELNALVAIFHRSSPNLLAR